jgi:hypothetical protein
MPARKLLVIDASVSRAAGGKDSIHPVSKDCRDFLKEIHDICYHVVYTKEIREQWDKIIVSLDENARGLFARASGSVKEIKEIVWINPAKKEDTPIEWLKDGANADINRQLCHFID